MTVIEAPYCHKIFFKPSEIILAHIPMSEWTLQEVNFFTLIGLPRPNVQKSKVKKAYDKVLPK
jgi:hypothetical protein